jgi:hypothetical protein
MELTEIFKDSLIYPTKDWNKLVILGALMTIASVFTISAVISVFTMNFLLTGVFALIAAISFLIVGLIYNGYSLSIIKETIENKQLSDDINSFPDFDWTRNIVDGIKVFILGIVYMIIPLIITVIFAYALGLFNVGTINQYVTFTNGSYLSNSASFVDLRQFSLNINIMQGVFSILTLIFTLFMMIAKAKLAETSKLSSIFEFKEIFNSISKIRWGNYIVWYILLIIIEIIIGFIGGLIALIPIIGLIVFFLIFVPVLLIFESRAIGLIYNESKY